MIYEVSFWTCAHFLMRFAEGHIRHLFSIIGDWLACRKQVISEVRVIVVG